MTKRNRNTLAGNFADGEMPTQEAFADLIDSMVNIVDDGFDKSPQDGLKLAQLNNHSKLVSFYDEITVKEALWSISFTMSGYDSDAGRKSLNFSCGGDDKNAGLTLASAPQAADAEDESTQPIRVGINKNSPDYELDVNGVIAADGRIGRAGKKEKQVRADGNWHPIITGLDGCQAFEIMAGVGKKRSGRYALLHAYALNTFNASPGWFSWKRGKIVSHQAHYSSRCDQIDLRWTGKTNDYSLEMRTRCNFEQNPDEQIYIRYYITRLWFDPFMESCVVQAGGNPGVGME